MTADGPVGQYLANLTGPQVVQPGRRAGGRLRRRADHLRRPELRPRPAVGDRPGVVPARRRPLADRPLDRPSQRRLVPGRIPQIIALLMDQRPAGRDAGAAARAGPSAAAAWPTCRASTRSAEIAIITRAAPARILGLAHKGHLGPGADADVTIYAPDDDRRRMFALPRYVDQGGRGRRRRRRAAAGARTAGRCYVAPRGRSRDRAPSWKAWFAREASIHPANFGSKVDDLADPLEIGPRRERFRLR